jgi:formate-dependent nitrite reductase cytochrome c552 subunit
MSLLDFIFGMAKSSQNTGKPNTLSDLGKALSKSDYKTSRGTNYTDSPRGASKVLVQAYNEAKKTKPKVAEEIAKNFVGKTGKPAWDK